MCAVAGRGDFDSCILQLVTSATCFGLAWQSSDLQRLVSIKVHNVNIMCAVAGRGDFEHLLQIQQ